MLTVLMECRDQEAELAQTLSILVTAAVEGLVSDVIVLDHASRDGSSRVADAAGCRFHSHWDIKDILRSARGEWLLFIEAGARPQSGWIEEVMEHLAINKQAARFSPSRNYRRPLFKRIGRSLPPLEYGLLVQKKNAIAAAKSGMTLEMLAKGHKATRLVSQLIPAWVLRAR
ncbi:glycosyltransferase family A protein [Neorhizobium sp. NCHU2750]|uniref:glycosyltransferase family A protein n=1 Tax=Neorhizobium sp. NCHU2750 TaxID=1825976 RepID=UPI000E76B54D|nr:glycosyltransferase [Neorhizobium sp. NCHU2750]